jgi:hypothetical protein
MIFFASVFVFSVATFSSSIPLIAIVINAPSWRHKA